MRLLEVYNNDRENPDKNRYTGNIEKDIEWDLSRRRRKVNKGSAPQDSADFPCEHNKKHSPLFPCDISALICLGECEEKNEITLDFGLRTTLACQGWKLI